MATTLTHLDYVNLFHLLAVGPALAYIGYEKMQGRALPASVWKALFAVGVLVAVFHAYRLYVRHS